MNENTELAITMTGVTEFVEGYPVELICNSETHNRLAIKAINEGGNNIVLIDLFDLINWLRFNPNPLQKEV
jgi:hypothetical protein